MLKCRLEVIALNLKIETDSSELEFGSGDCSSRQPKRMCYVVTSVTIGRVVGVE